MSEKSEKLGLQDEQAIEAIIAEAELRPTPTQAVMQQAKAAVKAEWQGRVRRRRGLRSFGIAASMLVAVFVATQFLQPAIIDSVQVATIDRLAGDVHTLGEDGLLHTIDSESSLLNDQTIRTTSGARVGIRWGQGGSLRLDEKTVVRLLAPDVIELQAGRIYYDSNNGQAPSHTLRIKTPYGDVEHVGTQFMTDVRNNDVLRVSVREGAVTINGRFHDRNVESGKQIELTGDREPLLRSLPSYASDWQWTNDVTPVFDTNGMSLVDILEWIESETGLVVNYKTEAAKKEALLALVEGVDADDPLVALSQAIKISDMNYEVITGVITVW